MSWLPARWLEWRHQLEIANGVWTIVSAYLVVFLVYHLIKVGRQRRVWRRWGSLPLSIQLAIGVLIGSCGVVVTRSVTWWSRYSNGGYIELRNFDTAGYWFGTILGVVGFMCILRVSTKPMLGHAPWIAALISCGAYVLWSLIRLS